MKFSRSYYPNDHPDKITNLSGINDPYEIPVTPDLIIDTTSLGTEECMKKLHSFIRILEFSGIGDNRSVTLKIIDHYGEVRVAHKLTKNDLSYKP